MPQTPIYPPEHLHSWLLKLAEENKRSYNYTVIELLEKAKADSEAKCTGNCGSNYCDENGCVDRKRSPVMVSPMPDVAIPQFPKDRIG